MSSRQDQKITAVNEAIIKEIIEMLSSLRYGYLHITVHNSRIVQVEKSEKTRFDDMRLVEKGGGI